MLRLILGRIVTTLPVIGVVAITIFLLLRLSPGDPAAVIAGDGASPETIAAIRIDLGLDQPLLVQFGTWIGQLLSGDLGTSVFSHQPVQKLIAQRVGPTVSLALMTLIFSILVAVPAGVLAAARHGTWIDRAIMAMSVAGFSIPVFVVGYLLIYFLSIKLGLFPVQGYVAISDDIFGFIRHITLPMLALGLIYIALFARITRSTMLEVLNEDFIRTARAKGLTRTRILVFHALRNAAVPIISVIGLGFASMVGGVVVTETVFNIPGIGRLVVDAVLARDYPVIQGIILVLAVVYVAINLAIDILYMLVDPRIRY